MRCHHIGACLLAGALAVGCGGDDAATGSGGSGGGTGGAATGGSATGGSATGGSATGGSATGAGGSGGSTSTSCQDHDDCASGLCVGDVCCDTSCDAVCVACAEILTGMPDGTCAPVTAGTDPTGQCVAEAPETCGAAGQGCNGDADAPGCVLHPVGTECAAPSCAGGLLTPAAECDGGGTCSPATEQTCAPYACNGGGDACGDSCNNENDCAADAYCSTGSGVCVSTAPPGTPCNQSNQCATDACVDGFCCDTQCAGLCEACAAGITGDADGTCAPISQGLDPVDECPDFMSWCDGGGACETCVTGQTTLSPADLDLLVIVDRSGSMGGPKWLQVQTELPGFFNDSASTGTNAAMNFFPVEGALDQCDTGLHNPPQFGPGALPGFGAVLEAALAAETPNGLTPTEPALLGALQWATATKDANLAHEVSVVFISDGDPTGCNTDVNVIASFAAAAYNYNSTQTFTIGLPGATIATMNQIAAAGGTGQAYTAAQGLDSDLATIRDLEHGCHYALPAVGDPTLLNVHYNGAAIPRALNEADCGGSDGWFADDPADPLRITFCPSLCGQVQADPSPQVELYEGCGSIPN